MKRILISALTLIISLGLTWISICPTHSADLVAQSRDRLHDEMNEDFSSPPERILDVSPASSQAIRIRITPDRSVVRPGEEISMSVETDVDCFLTLLSLGFFRQSHPPLAESCTPVRTIGFERIVP